MESKTGRQIHGQAAKKRETGEFLESLKLTDEALLAYQSDSDWEGFTEVLADRSISLRHLAEQSENNQYLILAKHELEAAIEIAESSNLPEILAVACFNLGKNQEALGQEVTAVESYQKALDNLESNPPKSHADRPGIIADYKIHLNCAKYKSGDKNSLDEILNALKDLEDSEEDSYNKNVWLSGGHMHLAESLKDDNQDLAKEHLQKAKKIIDSDERLKLRLTQWEKLSERFI